MIVYPTVMFAYEQCLLVLGHHPDVWYEAAQYLEQSSKLLAEKGVCALTFISTMIRCVCCSIKHLLQVHVNCDFKSNWDFLLTKQNNRTKN